MKEYKITFTADYCEYKRWADEGDKFWRKEVENNPEKLAMCEKYEGKTVNLSDIPEFIEEVGECVINNDEIEIYNDYRE